MKGDKYYDENMHQALHQDKGVASKGVGNSLERGGAQAGGAGSGPRGKETIPIHFEQNRICKEVAGSQSRQAQQRVEAAGRRAQVPGPGREVGWQDRPWLPAGARVVRGLGIGNRWSPVSPSTMDHIRT